MIEEILLENFKSARHLTVPTRALTVLAGLNGSGKSTVLQAIGLVKQLYLSGTFERLPLRGPIVNLGRSEEVHFENALSDDFCISLQTAAGAVRFQAFANTGADTLNLHISGDRATLLPVVERFQFIQADRLTPATLYDEASTPHQETGWLGTRGEFTVDYLRRNQDRRISDARSWPSSDGADDALLRHIAPTSSLVDQVAAWLQQLSPGVRIRADAIELADANTLRFQYVGSNLDSTSRAHRPSNVGFGLTYSLPIVVACLAAEPGALLLLENPEAHLHPRGQAALGRLLSRSCADGVQVIVESHSDHLLNGIRVAVKSGEIRADDVALHYFSRNLDSGETRIQTPRLLPDGQLDSWPAGFFDQWDRSLDALLE